MPGLPEWAPNAHPLVVHFPIALAFAAALVDGAALVARRRALHLGAVVLYALAALGALGAFLTGRRAVDTVEVPAQAVSTLTTHADLALYTAWAFGLYAVFRIALAAWDGRNRLAVHLPAALLGIGAVVLVWQTAEHGAELVFRHGVGVKGVVADEEPPGSAEGAAPRDAAPSAFSAKADGGWWWQPLPGQPLPDAFELLVGDREAVHPLPPGTDALFAFHLASGPLMLVAGDALAGVKLDAVLDLSGFDGTVALVHHVRGADAYDFLAFDGETVVQGRREGERRTVFAEDRAPLAGGGRLRATADGTHFYGYVGGRTVVHGHGPAPAPGRTGLRFDGTGTVRLGVVTVTPTR